MDKTGLWIKIGQQKEVVDVYTAQYYNWNKFVIKYTSYFLILLKLEENPKLAPSVSPPLALAVQMEHVL